MAYSSLMGADKAPAPPSGRSNDLLGPSDNSDSGSDALGTSEIHGDSDSAGTGESSVLEGPDPREGADILPDHVVQVGHPGDDSSDGMSDTSPDDQEFTDLDPEPEPDTDTGSDDHAR